MIPPRLLTIKPDGTVTKKVIVGGREEEEVVGIVIKEYSATLAVPLSVLKRWMLSDPARFRPKIQAISRIGSNDVYPKSEVDALPQVEERLRR